MYGCTENLPILQDFVPYRGRCPKRVNSLESPQVHLLLVFSLGCKILSMRLLFLLGDVMKRPLVSSCCDVCFSESVGHC